LVELIESWQLTQFNNEASLIDLQPCCRHSEERLHELQLINDAVTDEMGFYWMAKWP